MAVTNPLLAQTWFQIGDVPDRLRVQVYEIPLAKDYTRWMDRMRELSGLADTRQYLSHLRAVKEALNSLHAYQFKLATQIEEMGPRIQILRKKHCR